MTVRNVESFCDSSDDDVSDVALQHTTSVMIRDRRIFALHHANEFDLGAN